MLVGALAAIFAVLVAGVASPFFPTGLARTAEPSPGFHLDAEVLVLGAVAVVVVVVVLSAWPAHPGYQLRRTWRYKGRRYKLRPGVYRWYVWPGIGRISAGRFGPMLGSSTFVVTK